MRAQPTAQQGPKALHGIHMHFTQAVAIFIAREFASSVVDMLMIVTPRLQTGINAILVRIYTGAWHDGVFDEGFNGLLLHIGQQIEHDLTTALHHPKDRRSFLRQGATPRFALESASTSLSLLALDYLWLAFMASNHIGFIALDLVGQRHGRLFFTIPSRS
jgi:hypothetical protein